jgi:hypothetical protein
VVVGQKIRPTTAKYMKYIFIYILFSFTLSCSNVTNNNDKRIQGYWTDSNAEFALLVITEDSIWYPDSDVNENSKFPYKTINNLFIVDYYDRVDSFYYHITNEDTLHFTDDIGDSYFFRFKG